MQVSDRAAAAATASLPPAVTAPVSSVQIVSSKSLPETETDSWNRDFDSASASAGEGSRSRYHDSSADGYGRQIGPGEGREARRLGSGEEVGSKSLVRRGPDLAMDSVWKWQEFHTRSRSRSRGGRRAARFGCVR